YRRSFESADGIRRNGRLAVGVAHDIDQQAASALFLAHLNGAVVWIPPYQFLSNLAREGADLIESGSPVKWHHDVGSEQASGLHKAHQPKLVQQVAQRKSGRADLGESVIRRIYVVVRRGRIEDHLVRALDPIRSATPSVQGGARLVGQA